MARHNDGAVVVVAVVVVIVVDKDDSDNDDTNEIAVHSSTATSQTSRSSGIKQCRSYPPSTDPSIDPKTYVCTPALSTTKQNRTWSGNRAVAAGCWAKRKHRPRRPIWRQNNTIGSGAVGGRQLSNHWRFPPHIACATIQRNLTSCKAAINEAHLGSRNQVSMASELRTFMSRHSTPSQGAAMVLYRCRGCKCWALSLLLMLG